MQGEWYYADQGQQRGPVTFEELRERAAAGLLKPTDLVWRPGLEEWLPASTQAGLFAVGPPPAAMRRREVYETTAEYPGPPAPRGLGAGWKIAGFGCLGALLFTVLCCGVLLLAGKNAGSKTNTFEWSLGIGESRNWHIPFHEGDNVVINVASDQGSDMDLFVFSDKASFKSFSKAPNIDKALDLCLAHDNRFDKDCRVEFTAPASRDYVVLLINRKSEQPERNGHNAGKLVFEPGPR